MYGYPPGVLPYTTMTSTRTRTRTILAYLEAGTSYRRIKTQGNEPDIRFDGPITVATSGWYEITEPGNHGAAPYVRLIRAGR